MTGDVNRLHVPGILCTLFTYTQTQHLPYMERYTYPAAPGTPVTIAVSPGFRKQAIKVIASIALFCAVYITKQPVSFPGYLI